MKQPRWEEGRTDALGGGEADGVLIAGGHLSRALGNDALGNVVAGLGRHYICWWKKKET